MKTRKYIEKNVPHAIKATSETQEEKLKIDTYNKHVKLIK